MTKVNEHFPTPGGVNPQCSPSQTIWSDNDAGGEVPRDQIGSRCPRQRRRRPRTKRSSGRPTGADSAASDALRLRKPRAQIGHGWAIQLKRAPSRPPRCQSGTVVMALTTLY
jgi:hypothetical protein